MHSPSPLDRPPLPHTRHGSSTDRINVRWFILGLLFVALVIAGLVVWAITSSHSAELPYASLEAEVRSGTVTDLDLSGDEVSGRFTTTRQAYGDEVRASNESPPAGYSESDVRPVTGFTATIPDGRRERFIELARQHNVPIELE